MIVADRYRRQRLLRLKLDRLLDLAVHEVGAPMTTHEAKEHFLRSGHPVAAHRLHLTLCGLADPQANPRRTRERDVHAQFVPLRSLS